MSCYKFKYKRFFLFRTIKAVGHRYDRDLQRMDVYHANGAITSIPAWHKYTLFLGVDWVLFTKKQMEKEAGQKINLEVVNE